MNPDQVNQLLTTLSEIAKALSTTKSYTITGAADWPILYVVGGGFAALALAAWYDLRSLVMKNQADGKSDLIAHKAENKDEHKAIWDAMKDCQSDCCPRGKD